VVHGLQGKPSAFAHAVVSGEDASGQRLRSELPLLERQYPGSSGKVLKVFPDIWHADPKGQGRQMTSSSLVMAS
jgi:hypothetical protein